VLWVYVTPTNELKINEEDFDDGAAPP
jgi:hypothetical protein